MPNDWVTPELAIWLAQERIKVEREALPALPPPHMEAAWHAVVLRLMAGDPAAEQDAETLRVTERAYWAEAARAEVLA